MFGRRVVHDLQFSNHDFPSEFSRNLPGCLPVGSDGYLTVLIDRLLQYYGTRQKSAEAPSEANAGRACRGKAGSQIQPNPNPSPLGEGFMPPPYPLHGSGPVSCWSAVTG